MSRRASVVAVAVGLALLVGAPVIWWLQQPPSSVGDLDALDVPADAGDESRTDPDNGRDPTASTDPEVGGPTDTGPDPEPPAASRDEDATSSPGPAIAPLASGASPLSGSIGNLARPTRIDIPALGVSSPVDPVGIAASGEMQIPDDIRRIGWFEPGVIPGRNGTAVFSGHVDSRTQGRGDFYRLRELDVDDTVTITHANGTERTWRVAARTSYGKDELPIDDIFVRGGQPRLALITCDGSFDATTRSYQDNVVVYAVPA